MTPIKGKRAHEHEADEKERGPMRQTKRKKAHEADEKERGAMRQTKRKGGP
jgi:hypothetical protein